MIHTLHRYIMPFHNCSYKIHVTYMYVDPVVIEKRDYSFSAYNHTF